MPSQRDTARKGLSARSVRRALNGPMFPIPRISAPRLTRDIYNQSTQTNVLATETLRVTDET